MTLATPKAVQAFVIGVVKEKLLDSADGGPALDAKTCFLALLKMELVHRGVLVAPKDRDIPKWDSSKTLDAVRLCIGKSVLPPGGHLPRRLLIASSFVAGRTAELCASVLQSSPPAKLDSIEVQSALKRCKEVQDPRFQVLLELVGGDSGGGGGGGARPKTLLIIAEGYYRHCALLQPDTPQTWKRTYDVILTRHKMDGETEVVSPADAGAVLGNMARIADGKGNKKRAAELSVFAAESYLQLATAVDQCDVPSVIHNAAKAFVAPNESPVTDPIRESAEALAYCQRHLDFMSPDDLFILKILKVQLLLAREDQVLAEESMQEIGHDGPASALRDDFLLRAKNDSSSPMRQRLAATVLTQVLRRNKDRARARAKIKSCDWLALAHYVMPFLDAISGTKEEMESAMASFSKEEVDLFETYVCLVPCLEWMDESCRKEIPTNLLVAVRQALEVLLARDAKVHESASSALKLSSAEAFDDVKLVQRQCARAFVQSLLLLFQKGDRADEAEWNAHVEFAVNMAQQRDKFLGASTEHGTAFAVFLVAWSGLGMLPWALCTSLEARLVWKNAQQCLAQAQSGWGRQISTQERVLLDLASADIDCGLSGGLAKKAHKGYNLILEQIDCGSLDLTGTFETLVRSHCLIGLTRSALRNGLQSVGLPDLAELCIKSLDKLKCITDTDAAEVTEDFWFSPSSLVHFHITVTQDMITEAHVRSGQAQKAKAFLFSTVRSSPKDATAAFSLGSFLLRDALLVAGRTTSAMTLAKQQLLKAAQLDPNKAGPFALLGVWYEDQNDTKRAVGCYAKALLLEPANPVAGRGVLRLSSRYSVKAVVEAAIRTGSSTGGWAWRALGVYKVMVKGENEFGAVALLKALRSRDISQPQHDTSSLFFRIPLSAHINHSEKAETLSELAFCYRSLGRYTAARRSYLSSIEAAGPKITGSVLCACAEVELGLGLAEEASEKFKQALKLCDPSTKAIATLATYGQGLSLLFLAQRDVLGGRASAAYGHIRRALQGLDGACGTFGCTQKLLGDLYSLGATLPPDIFTGLHLETIDIPKQITFAEKGEACYKLAVRHFLSVSDNTVEADLLTSAMTTDAGTNLLLRAKLTSFHQCGGVVRASTYKSGATRYPNALKHCDCASVEFLGATEISPDYALAWCGLGCSLLFSDPLMSQHAFSRSLQLDSFSSDVYSNLGLLYTAHGCFSGTKGVMHALTKAADSPMTWINLALMLERNVAVGVESVGSSNVYESAAKAADAYRAALQVVEQPSTLLGLALAGRISASNTSDGPRKGSLFQESHGYLKQYEGRTGSNDLAVSLLTTIASMEGIVSDSNGDAYLDLKERQLMSELALGLAVFDEAPSEDVKLDIEPIQQLLLEQAPDQAKAATSTLTTTTVARHIVHEPHRGDLWVDLAKQFFRHSEASTMLPSALVASSRGSSALAQQLGFPNYKAGTQNSSKVVSYLHISEAFSVRYWILNLFSRRVENCVAVDLQKAFVVCPTSAYVHEVLAKAVFEEKNNPACR